MAPSPDKSTPGFTDYVVRVTHPTRYMRSIVIRATDEQDAVERVLNKMQADGFAGWSLLDVATVEEAQARREGRREVRIDG